MNRPLVSLSIAAAVALPFNGCGNQSPRVPHIVGLALGRAERQLFSEHLRWRIAPDTQIYSRPLPPNQHTSMDDIPVTGQQPAAGRKTRPDAVITIITPCTATRPCS
jgi:hypothetical protein